MAVPPGSDPRPVRCFSTFTEDLQALRDWLLACGVTTGALGSTGGKIYSVKTRDVKSRVAEALRLAAQSLHRAQNYFGELYRRWRALAPAKAILFR